MKVRVLLAFLTGVLLVLGGCEKTTELPVPQADWDVFQSPDAVPLAASDRTVVEGVYTTGAGTEMFGGQVAMKWSYLANGQDTTYHLSIFCSKDVAYLVMEGRKIGEVFYFQGYWRKMINTQTGRVRLSVDTQNLPSALMLEGVFGNGGEVPTQPLAFSYKRPLNVRPFDVLAHRSGGRTSDLLPASENSLEMIRLTSRFGSTGIEIDVRLTKDGIPVLYHDNTLNLRLTRKNGLSGSIEDYTYSQLNAYVRLIRGERIPTLEEALETVLTNTALDFVWLDTKYEGSLSAVRDIQKKYLQRATLAGRKLDIVIGLPGEKPLEMFLALPDYASAPALCELDLATVRKTNARVWAPRWTLGTLDAEVAEMKAEGRKVFVWTMDVPEYIRQYTEVGHFDGILSNYPSAVAYYHYTRE